MSRLTPLVDLLALDAAIAESRERPVLLFKHSRYCGVSCEALDELQAHIERGTTGAAYKMITVQTHRPISDAAADRLGLRHETPQAILLREGKVVWNASHFRITAVKLDEAVPNSHLPIPNSQGLTP
ncbi:MAG TPA: bacillithiol system redox-active protein YtxJ [Vicinamibacterales bacterium]|nr:bacillithiol system redox-active protein YtxJ [Vicinamibacterales bacterium]